VGRLIYTILRPYAVCTNVHHVFAARKDSSPLAKRRDQKTIIEDRVFPSPSLAASLYFTYEYDELHSYFLTCWASMRPGDRSVQPGVCWRASRNTGEICDTRVRVGDGEGRKGEITIIMEEGDGNGTEARWVRKYGG